MQIAQAGSPGKARPKEGLQQDFAKDAIEYLDHIREKFDLVILDCYRGKTIGERFTSASFIRKCLKLTNDHGSIVINILDFYAPRAMSKLVKELKDKFRLKKIKTEFNSLLFVD